MLFKSLIPDVYQTNVGGNKHLDILNVSRAAKFADDSSIKTIMSEKDWVKFFKKNGYNGDYYWFVP